MKKKQDYEIKFWKDWLESDLLKREELVENLHMVKSVWDLKEMPENLRKRALTTMLNGFFEDLESAVYTKISLEKSKNT